MARRRVTATVRCARAGCREVAHFEYDSQRERQESDRWRKDHPWRCFRHTNEDEVLSPTNPERTTVLTAVKVESHGRTLRGLYWQAEGESPTSGLEHGPGFKAIASDLPEGTRLIVTARIELPDTATDQLRESDPKERTVTGQHTIAFRDGGWVVEHPTSCPLAEFGCAVSLAAEDLDGAPVPPGRYEVFVDDVDGRMWVGDVVLAGAQATQVEPSTNSAEHLRVMTAAVRDVWRLALQWRGDDDTEQQANDIFTALAPLVAWEAEHLPAHDQIEASRD